MDALPFFFFPRAQLQEALDDVRGLPAFAPALRLLDVSPRPYHHEVYGPLLDIVGSSQADVAEVQVNMLIGVTRPGGPLDPQDERSDVPWCAFLRGMADAAIGSRAARRWFIHLDRLRQADVAVALSAMAVAAYAVARFEALRGRHQEAAWWARTASMETDTEDEVGLGVVVVLRAALLLG